MSITATTLAADLSANSNTVKVTSGTGFPTAGGPPQNPGYLMRIDKEYMLAVVQPVSGTIKVAQRGYNGTAVVAHDILSPVLVSASPSDFDPIAPGNDVDLTPAQPIDETIGEDRTFTAAEVASWGTQPRNFPINKATAAAIVLVAPSKAQDGLEVTFTSLTAAIHVITATGLLANAGAASPYTTATMANATKGGGLRLQARNGLWSVISATNWTLT
jgi:hypothetical protein